MVNKSWTEKEEEQLKKEYCWRNNEEIARDLGKSVNAVYLKASRLGLTKTFIISDPEDLQLLKCFGKGIDETCIERCPGWLECLEKYSQDIKKELELEYELKRITIKGPTTAERLLQVIREARIK